MTRWWWSVPVLPPVADAGVGHPVDSGGPSAALTTKEIAVAFLVPEATMAQRISRAKARLAGPRREGFLLPAAGERTERLRSVLHVLYLMFNEGYATSSGPDLATSRTCPARRSG